MLEIRLALPQDAEKCAQIHIDSWNFAYSDYVSGDKIDKVNEGRFKLWKKLLANNVDTQYVIADDAAILGIISIEKTRDSDLSDDFCELVSIYLEPGFIGKGIGSFAMDWIKNEALFRGFGNISLWVHKENRRAKEFYIKHDFNHDGVKKEVSVGTVERYVLKI